MDRELTNVLFVDLSKKSFRVEARPELFEKYLGGAGVAAALLSERCPAGADPLSPDNPIVFAVGPATALFPMASKTVAMFKSPHTGNLGESHCGGRSAAAIRLAGYGAIVIEGKSDMPLYLAVHGDRVRFRDARAVWGMRSSSTPARIIRAREEGRGLRTIMRIGRAGERMVSWAGVTTETYRHFGRLGLGAVFGSKMLKAVVVSGGRSIPVAAPKAYRDVYDKIHHEAVSTPATKKYHDLGTPENVLPLNELKGFPTRNLSSASFEGARALSGESLAQNHLGRRLACAHCPVGCIHLAALREPYPDEKYFYKTTMIGYDYEHVYAIGAMLGLSDPQEFFKLLDLIENLGLDVMSAGVILAWATEAMGKGMVSEKETDGLALAFGDAAAYAVALEKIVSQPNDFYQALAKGVEHAAGIYGGLEFALSFGGNEMPGYHTGPAAHLGYLIGSRHSHLDNGGYGVDQKKMIKDPLGPEELVTELVKEERWRQVLSGLVVCFFARGIYKPEIVIEALAAAGVETTESGLERIGREVHLLKHKFKIREGFDPTKLRIPDRILQTPSPAGDVDESFIRNCLDIYKKEMER